MPLQALSLVLFLKLKALKKVLNSDLFEIVVRKKVLNYVIKTVRFKKLFIVFNFEFNIRTSWVVFADMPKI